MSDATSFLNSILDAIDSKLEHEPSEAKSDEVDAIENGTTKAEAVKKVDELLAPTTWTRYFDSTTGKFYYHNSHTQVTTWDQPEQFVSSESLYPVDKYAAKAAFLSNSGKFTATTPYDRDIRQMSAFFNVDDLDENRRLAKEKKKKIAQMGIDWKEYTAEKKKQKRAKQTEWLLKEDDD